MGLTMSAPVLFKGGSILLPDGLVANPGLVVYNGKIAHIGLPEAWVAETGDFGAADVKVVDCTDCVLTAGLVDLHTHLYQHATPLGIDPAICLASGVTTAVDGGSAGALTFPGLRHYVAERSECQVLAFLHLAAHGLAAAGCSGPEFGPGGESDHVNCLKTQLCTRTLQQNKDLLIGVKIRLDQNITDEGRNEAEVLKRGIEAAGGAGLPLMVHHTMSTLSLATVLTALRPGDIYTHCYSAWAGEGGSLVDRKTRKMHKEVVQARDRGIVFDLGHGQGSLDWEVAEIAMEQSFPPDTISTDLHSGNVAGAARNLPWVTAKLLHLGMPLEAALRAVTEVPANTISRGDQIGSLQMGRVADLALLRVVEGREGEEVEDSLGAKRIVRVKVETMGVWRRGRRVV